MKDQKMASQRVPRISSAASTQYQIHLPNNSKNKLFLTEAEILPRASIRDVVEEVPREPTAKVDVDEIFQVDTQLDTTIQKVLSLISST